MNKYDTYLVKCIIPDYNNEFVTVRYSGQMGEHFILMFSMKEKELFVDNGKGDFFENEGNATKDEIHYIKTGQEA